MAFDKKAHNKAYRAANLEKIKARAKERYNANKEKSREYALEYRAANRDEINAKKRAYYAANKEKEKARLKAHNEANKDIISARGKAKRKAYYESNKEAIDAEREVRAEKRKVKLEERQAQRQAYYEANKEEIDADIRKKRKARYKEYYANNKEQENKRKKQWKKDNPDKLKAQRKAYYVNNINVRLANNLRSRVYLALKNNAKSAHTLQLLGCDIAHFKTHLAKRFDKRMNWNNYGSHWHIDHIVPCARFDLQRADEQVRCFHYSNLQPLQADVNLSKGDRLDHPVQVVLVA